MKVQIEPLKKRGQSVSKIESLSNQYCKDLDYCFYQGEALSEFDFEEYFYIIRSIPYVKDTKPIEIIARPFIIWAFREYGADCKKRCIMVLAYCKLKNIDTRIVTSSRRKDKREHHIFPQVFISGQWINADCTYPEYFLGQPKIFTGVTLWTHN